MRDVREVCCGDVSPRRTAAGGGEPGLALDAHAGRTDPAHVTLHVEQLTRRLVANLPPRLIDLLEIATYVYCADQLSRRDTVRMARMGDRWRRSFAFRVAVREPDFWGRDDVRGRLEATLGFLSDDHYAFEFTRTARGGGPPPYLDLGGDGAPSGFRPEEVILFSGGLDSLAGAVDALVVRKVPVALVSHISSPMVQGIQRGLAAALRRRAGRARVLHVGMTATAGGRAVEFTQRARSFLFASLGFLVARVFDLSELRFFENGVVGLNLPLAQHVLGTRPRARPTRGRCASSASCSRRWRTGTSAW
jgi:hypothetical protein